MVSADKSVSAAKLPETREEWFEMVDRMVDESGYLEPLGKKHWAFFTDESPTLIVSFAQLDDVRAQPEQMPLGYSLAKTHGWSHLGIISDGLTWFRDSRVFGYFDRLVDEAFFDDFDRVIFVGSGAQGYAAAAFSVAAPGCDVILMSPRATLLPAVAGWDRRDMASRRLDFTSRYGFGPDMVGGARKVHLFFDPDVQEDAMHAALFKGDFVQKYKLPLVGGQSEWALTQMQLMPKIIEQTAANTLTAVSFAKLWRARRNFGPYLRNILARAESSGRTAHEKRICRSVTNRLQAPRFRKRLSDILAAEAEAEAAATLSVEEKGARA